MKHRGSIFLSLLPLFALSFLSSVRSTNAELAEDALRATVRIAGKQSGTGFFVHIRGEGEESGQHVLVTATHVFKNIDGSTCEIVLRGKVESGQPIRRETKLVIRDGGRPLWVSHPEVDVAVMAMDLPKGIDIKAFEYDQIGEARLAELGEVRVGQNVVIPCFPAQTEANPAGWPILRKGSIATHPLTPVAEAKTMFLDYSHFGGDSGSPVVAMVAGKPVVVGLVTAMQRQTDKSVTPFEERTVHTPLDLAIAVQSPLVRQTVERWREQKTKEQE